MHTSYPAHTIHFYLIILIIKLFGEKYNLRSSLLCSFSNLLPFHPSSVQIYSSAPCSLNVRDQVSHTCKTTGKIIILHILMFTFLYHRREDKRF
jgi:hypothetical protein